MENAKEKEKPMNSKGAAIFKKILDDKKALHEHMKNGGKISDFKRTKSLSSILYVKENVEFSVGP